jgi:hypothetical protein
MKTLIEQKAYIVLPTTCRVLCARYCTAGTQKLQSSFWLVTPLLTS